LVDVRSLLEAPSPAVLTVYRPDGQAVTSPVWFRVDAEHVEVVVAAGDTKVDYLRADPRCVLLIFETVRPFRGLRIRGEATLVTDDRAASRRAIATRYLGEEAGERYADRSIRPPGFVLRLPLSQAKTWDLSETI
jgi:PPOX class probable F420-dependent enzyme